MKRKTLISLGGVAAIFAAVLLLPLVYNGNYIYNVLCQIACYYIATVGLNFITGMTGQPMLGMAGVFAVGAYSSALLSNNGWDPFLTLPVALLLGLVVGLILGYPSLRLSGVYLSFTTIGFSEIVRILVSNLTSITGGGTGVKNIPNFSLFGYEFASMRQKLFLLMAFGVLVSLFASKIIRSIWGKYFIAIRDNIDAVPACGHSVTTIKLVAFCMATMLGSLAGALYSHMTNYITPATFTQTLSITLVSMMIIGGMGSVWGCLLGSTVVIFLPELLRFTGRFYDLTYAVIVMIVVVLIPRGLINLFNKKSGITRGTLVKIFLGGK